MHRDPGVPEHRLDPRRGDIDGPIPIGQPIAERHEFPVDVLVLHLGVGERRPVLRAPVDDPLAAIDQAGLVHPHERHPNRVLQALVHREPQPAPVAGVPERPHLFDDSAAVPLLPVPHALDERLPADLLAVKSLVSEFALDHDLRGDAGMVGPGEPQRLEPLHPRATDHDVLQELREGMPDVQRPGHVRRRQHGCRSDPAIAPKYPRRSHSSYQRASAACASYAGGISVLMESPSLGDEPTEALSSVSHPAATLSDR